MGAHQPHYSKLHRHRRRTAGFSLAEVSRKCLASSTPLTPFLTPDSTSFTFELSCESHLLFADLCACSPHTADSTSHRSARWQTRHTHSAQGCSCTHRRRSVTLPHVPSRRGALWTGTHNICPRTLPRSLTVGLLESLAFPL